MPGQEGGRCGEKECASNDNELTPRRWRVIEGGEWVLIASKKEHARDSKGSTLGPNDQGRGGSGGDEPDVPEAPEYGLAALWRRRGMCSVGLHGFSHS